MAELASIPADIIAILRNCELPLGAAFVRCGRNLGPSGAAQTARKIRDAFGDDVDEVFFSFNQETGHNDYVRVNHGTNAFAAICALKS